MSFCTAINCMDGRAQLPVIKYLQTRFNAVYVDIITETGPNLILSENKDLVKIQSILDRLKISVEVHKSKGIAVVGHFDCAANPASREIQTGQLEKAIALIRQHITGLEIIGLWVDEYFTVHEVV